MQKPFSQACENNKEPILGVLREEFADCQRILEIGSGTGQHAVYFAEHLPHLFWQTSDLLVNHAGINSWLGSDPAKNLAPPVLLDVSEQSWPVANVDGIFTANSLHIMAWRAVQDFFRGAGLRLSEGGVLCVYGPFNYGGVPSSQSNARFDAWLRERDSLSGVRDFEALVELAVLAGLKLRAEHPMPASPRRPIPA